MQSCGFCFCLGNFFHGTNSQSTYRSIYISSCTQLVGLLDSNVKSINLVSLKRIKNALFCVFLRREGGGGARYRYENWDLRHIFALP